MVKKQSAERRVTDAAFRAEDVRILTTSGRTIREVAADLGVGVSSLGKWKSQIKEADLLAGPHYDVHKNWPDYAAKMNFSVPREIC